MPVLITFVIIIIRNNSSLTVFQQLEKVVIGTENAKRYFFGIQGDQQRKGELFGLKNMFSFSEKQSSLVENILEVSGKRVFFVIHPGDLISGSPSYTPLLLLNRTGRDTLDRDFCLLSIMLLLI